MSAVASERCPTPVAAAALCRGLLARVHVVVPLPSRHLLLSEARNSGRLARRAGSQLSFASRFGDAIPDSNLPFRASGAPPLAQEVAQDSFGFGFEDCTNVRIHSECLLMSPTFIIPILKCLF